MPDSLLYAVSWFWCNCYAPYLTIGFVLLSFENVYRVYSSMYFAGHVIVIVSIVLMLAFGTRPKKPAASSDTKKVR